MKKALDNATTTFITEIILEFKQREQKLFAQIDRRNQGLRLCKVELEEKDEELIRLKMLLEDKNNKIKILQNENNYLNNASIRHQKELEYKDKELFDLKSLLEATDKELFDSNSLLPDANKNINELQNEIKFLHNKILQSENLLKKEISDKDEEIIELLSDLMIKDETIEINKQEMINLTHEYDGKIQVLTANIVKNNDDVSKLKCITFDDSEYMCKNLVSDYVLVSLEDNGYQKDDPADGSEIDSLADEQNNSKDSLGAKTPVGGVLIELLKCAVLSAKFDKCVLPTKIDNCVSYNKMYDINEGVLSTKIDNGLSYDKIYDIELIELEVLAPGIIVSEESPVLNELEAKDAVTLEDNDECILSMKNDTVLKIADDISVLLSEDRDAKISLLDDKTEIKIADDISVLLSEHKYAKISLLDDKTEIKFDDKSKFKCIKLNNNRDIKKGGDKKLCDAESSINECGISMNYISSRNMLCNKSLKNKIDNENNASNSYDALVYDSTDGNDNIFNMYWENNDIKCIVADNEIKNILDMNLYEKLTLLIYASIFAVYFAHDETKRSGNKLLCAYNSYINNIIILNTYMKIIYTQYMINYIIYYYVLTQWCCINMKINDNVNELKLKYKNDDGSNNQSNENEIKFIRNDTSNGILDNALNVTKFINLFIDYMISIGECSENLKIDILLETVEQLDNYIYNLNEIINGLRIHYNDINTQLKSDKLYESSYILVDGSITAASNGKLVYQSGPSINALSEYELSTKSNNVSVICIYLFNGLIGICNQELKIHLVGIINVMNLFGIMNVMNVVTGSDLGSLLLDYTNITVIYDIFNITRSELKIYNRSLKLIEPLLNLYINTGGFECTVLNNLLYYVGIKFTINDLILHTCIKILVNVLIESSINILSFMSNNNSQLNELNIPVNPLNELNKMLYDTKRLSNLYHHQYRFFASASAFDGFSDQISKLKSSYPNLFNRDSFISDQEQLLSQYKSLNSLLSEFDAARESIDKATGEKVFIELNESTLINDLNTRNKPFYESLSENVNEIQEKLSTGQEYVNRVIELQSQQESALSIEDKNLQMIEIANVGDKIDEWQLSFADPVNDSSDLSLPISDEEVNQWVREQYHPAPDEVTYEQHKQVEENWMITLDNKLCDVLKERDPNFNEDKFMEFCAATNEMFHPHSIDHYGMSNYTKSLFRASLWQSKDRCNTVEESIEILINLLEDGRDDDSNIIRGVYEQSPNTRFNKVAAFQLKITDPLFAAKLIQEIRMKLEEIAIDRAQKEVLYELQVPYLQHERKELETELEETMSTNPANTQRSIKVLKEQEDSYNIEIPELENMLDEILPKRLWQNDISQVKQSIISYAKGNGSLNDIDKSINNTLSSNDPSTDTNLLNDKEILDISVKYHNSRTSNLENYNFEAFLNESTLKKDLASKLICRRMANKRLNSLNVDPLVVNLVKILIENGQGDMVKLMLNDKEQFIQFIVNENKIIMPNTHNNHKISKQLIDINNNMKLNHLVCINNLLCKTEETPTLSYTTTLIPVYTSTETPTPLHTNKETHALSYTKTLDVNDINVKDINDDNNLEYKQQTINLNDSKNECISNELISKLQNNIIQKLEQENKLKNTHSKNYEISHLESNSNDNNIGQLENMKCKNVDLKKEKELNNNLMIKYENKELNNNLMIQYENKINTLGNDKYGTDCIKWIISIIVFIVNMILIIIYYTNVIIPYDLHIGLERHQSRQYLDNNINEMICNQNECNDINILLQSLIGVVGVVDKGYRLILKQHNIYESELKSYGIQLQINKNIIYNNYISNDFKRKILFEHESHDNNKLFHAVKFIEKDDNILYISQVLKSMQAREIIFYFLFTIIIVSNFIILLLMYGYPMLTYLDYYQHRYNNNITKWIHLLVRFIILFVICGILIKQIDFIPHAQSIVDLKNITNNNNNNNNAESVLIWLYIITLLLDYNLCNKCIDYLVHHSMILKIFNIINELDELIGIKFDAHKLTELKLSTNILRNPDWKYSIE